MTSVCKQVRSGTCVCFDEKKKKEEEIVFDMSEMIGALEQPGVAEVISYLAL